MKGRRGRRRKQILDTAAGTAHPLQALQAQRGLRELGLLDFLTTALYGGRLSALRTGRLYPQGYSRYSFSLGAESTPGPWFGRKEICHMKNPVTPPGIDPGTVRLVAQRLNHYATPGPYFEYGLCINWVLLSYGLV